MTDTYKPFPGESAALREAYERIDRVVREIMVAAGMLLPRATSLDEYLLDPRNRGD